MKCLLVVVLVATIVGCVLSLPFKRQVDKKDALIPLARSLEAHKFVHFIHEANLTANFTRKGGNFTLFIPVDKAWEQLSQNITKNRTLLRDVLLFHCVNGTFARKDLKKDVMLKTLNGKFLHFNITKDKSVLVEGVNITKFNQRASNGYIFLISEVMNASWAHNKTNGTTPTREPLVKHLRTINATKFAHFIHEADMEKNFTKKAGNFTLFVPTNSAWESLSRNITGNKTVLRDLILAHAVKGTYSRKELTLGKKLTTLSGKNIYINVTKEKAVFVDGVNITSFNNWASNGNIFLIAKVMKGTWNRPNSTHPARRQLMNLNVDKREALIPHVRAIGATKFAHFVHELDMEKNFTRKAGNFTLFVPINSAWESLSRNITGNKTDLRDLILAHAVKGTYSRKELTLGKKLTTLSGKNIFFNVTKEKAVFVDGVNITSFNNWASNGNIFLIAKVMGVKAGSHNKTNTTKPTHLTPQPHQLFVGCPWEKNCAHNTNSGHSTDGKKEGVIAEARNIGATKFAHFVHEAGIEANFTKKAGNFTLFVPINSAWESLSRNITGNKTVLRDLILAHAVKGTYTRKELTLGKKLTTLSGKNIFINVTKEKTVFVDGVNITSFNNWASNGNIFLIAKVMKGTWNRPNSTHPARRQLMNLNVDKREALIPHVRAIGATKFAHFVHELDMEKNFTRKAGNFTLFVPINSAWESLSRNITGNKTDLRDLILAHAVKGTYSRKELTLGKKLTTLSGKNIFFNVTKEKAVFVDGVNITSFNNWASNGNIFLIAKVMGVKAGSHNKTNTTKPTHLTPLPHQLFVGCPWEKNCAHNTNSGHSTDGKKEGVIAEARNIGATKFAHFVHEAGIEANFTKKAGNFTLFVPVNSAWESLSRNITGNKTVLRDLILAHAVKGTYSRKELTLGKKLTTLSGKNIFINVTKEKAVFVDGVNITSFNNWASNGNIFLIAKVMGVKSGSHNKTNSTSHGGVKRQVVLEHLPRNKNTITHTLSMHWSRYSTLISNMMKSRVWADLEDDNVTLLAPTNAAFHSLSSTLLTNMENDPVLLEKTMKHHVLSGALSSNILKLHSEVTSASGKMVHVTLKDGAVHKFNNAIVSRVIETSDGYIYELKNVMTDL